MQAQSTTLYVVCTGLRAVPNSQFSRQAQNPPIGRNNLGSGVPSIRGSNSINSTLHPHFGVRRIPDCIMSLVYGAYGGITALGVVGLCTMSAPRPDVQRSQATDLLFTGDGEAFNVGDAS